jgi:hypothetical protein
MARAVRDGGAPRCSLDFALHVVEVMLAILKSGEEGRMVDLETTCERPAPLSPAEALGLMA